MANELFRWYLLQRERQDIPLVKTYSSILFVGSVAPRDVFEEGKEFHNLGQMADTVRVVVNSKDILLKMSSVAHLKNRIGNKGPKNPDQLPDFVKVYDIKSIINHLKRRGIGILISDHNVRETLGACDSAYILVEGQVLESGPPEKVAASEAVMQAYLGDEFQL